MNSFGGRGRGRGLGEPLAGRSVVLTRSAEDNRMLAHRLEELGAAVQEVPLNRIEPAPDGGEALARAVGNLERYQWVVFTSANGVAAVADVRGPEPWPDSVHVAVVGEATAETADAAGMPIVFIPSEATGACLADEFPTALSGPDAPDLAILAPLAELASSTVHDGLTAKGYLVDQVIAYRSSAPEVDPVLEPAIRATVTGADVVVFAAPSAAARFADRFADHLDEAAVPVICIGPSTAKRAVSLGFTVAAVAKPHNDDGLVEAIVWYLVDDAG